MTQKPSQSQYNQTINMTSHLILTQPKAVVALLAGYGVQFEEKPSRNELIAEVVELMKDSSQFSSDLGELLAIHLQENGREMMRLEGQNFNYRDEQEDAFLGGLIKGAAKLVGGLFKGKRRNRGDGGAAAVAAANAQVATIKRDMARQMAQMKAAAMAREAEDRRRREQEKLDREKRDKEEKEKQEAAKKQQAIILASVIGVVALGAVGLIVSKSNPKLPQYMPMPIQPVQPQIRTQPQMPMQQMAM